MNIRHGRMEDLTALTRIEQTCFPAAEAASEEELAARLRAYPEHFWLLEEGGRVVSFVNGMVTSEPTIRDEMFADAALHDPAGAWQAVFGVNTLPEYRRRGFAAQLLRAAERDARAAGRRGCILTCKDRLLSYYGRLGYQPLGVSASVHGGAVWYDMRLEF